MEKTPRSPSKCCGLQRVTGKMLAECQGTETQHIKGLKSKQCARGSGWRTPPYLEVLKTAAAVD